MKKQLPETFAKRHSDFIVFFDKVAWGAITAVAIYASSQLKEMSQSINELNKNVAVVLTKMQSYDSQALDFKNNLEKHESRLIDLERSR